MWSASLCARWIWLEALTMKNTSFAHLLGLTTTDRALIDAIADHGGDVARLSSRKISELGSDFVFLNATGVVLSFVTRAEFEASYERTPRGDGPYVLTTVFHYPQGSDHVEPYSGHAPFSERQLTTRAEALSTYGAPARTKGSEGEVTWDQWLIDGSQVRASYDDDQAVVTFSISVPMA